MSEPTSASIPADAPAADAPPVVAFQLDRGNAAAGQPSRFTAVFRSFGTTQLVGALLAVMALVAGGVGAYRWSTSGPGTDTINAYIASVIPAGKLRVKTVAPSVNRDRQGTLYVTFRALLETTEPLYVPADAAAYVRDELHADLATIARAEALLASTTGARLRDAAGATPVDPATLPLLKLSTPVGTEVPFAGIMTARKGSNGWQFEVEGGRPTAIPLAGQPRPPAPTRTYVVGDATDMAELTSLVRAREAYAKRIIAAHDAQETQQQELRQQALTALETGLFFRSEVNRGDYDATLWLEIAAVNHTTRSVTAYLRNDQNGRRRFSGRYTDATAREWPTLVLTTQAFDADEAGGPFIGLPGEWQITATLQHDTLTGTMTGGWKYTARRASAAEFAAYHSNLEARAAAERATKARPTSGRATSQSTVTPRPTVAASVSKPTASAPDDDADGSRIQNRGSAVENPSAGPTADKSAFRTPQSAIPQDAYPTVDGAYVKVGAEWRKLPRNTPIISRTTSQTLGTAASWVGAITGKRIELPPQSAMDRLGEISFGGNEPVPVASRQDVTIVYVGLLRSVPSEFASRDQIAAEIPVLAMAALRADSGGARRAALYRLVPGVLTFREGRLPGAFTRVNPRVAQLTVSGNVTPGHYAIAAGEEIFEVEVR